VDLLGFLQKPIITHNGMLDLMFLLDKFIEPLPDTVGEFKQKINALFPHIYDTKHLVNTRM
jgi:poly(A)-specific ribonuclease